MGCHAQAFPLIRVCSLLKTKSMKTCQKTHVRAIWHLGLRRSSQQSASYRSCQMVGITFAKYLKTKSYLKFAWKVNLTWDLLICKIFWKLNLTWDLRQRWDLQGSSEDSADPRHICNTSCKNKVQLLFSYNGIKLQQCTILPVDCQ